jgi:hypothetical protein
VGIRALAAQAIVIEIPPSVRAGVESSGVSVGALETARVTRLLPRRLPETEPPRSPDIASDAPPNAGLRLLGAGRDVSTVTILCDS